MAAGPLLTITATAASQSIQPLVVSQHDIQYLFHASNVLLQPLCDLRDSDVAVGRVCELGAAGFMHAPVAAQCTVQWTAMHCTMRCSVQCAMPGIRVCSDIAQATHLTLPHRTKHRPLLSWTCTEVQSPELTVRCMPRWMQDCLQPGLQASMQDNPQAPLPLPCNNMQAQSFRECLAEALDGCHWSCWGIV